MILFQSFRAFASVLEAMLAAGLLIPKWWPLRFEIPASTKTFLQDRCVMVGLQEGRMWCFVILGSFEFDCGCLDLYKVLRVSYQRPRDVVNDIRLRLFHLHDVDVAVVLMSTVGFHLGEVEIAFFKRPTALFLEKRFSKICISRCRLFAMKHRTGSLNLLWQNCST